MDFKVTKDAESARNQAYAKIADKQQNESVTVYNAMRIAMTPFTCHDVDGLLGKGTNIASRIFNSLMRAGYIKSNGNVQGLHGSAVGSYIVVDPEIDLDLELIRKLNKTTTEQKEVLSKIAEINENLILSNSTEIDAKVRQKVAAQQMLVINAFINQKEECVNMFAGADDKQNVGLKTILNHMILLTAKKVV